MRRMDIVGHVSTETGYGAGVYFRLVWLCLGLALNFDTGDTSYASSIFESNNSHRNEWASIPSVISRADMCYFVKVAIVVAHVIFV